MKCFFCGNEHDVKCPMIRAYEYRPDGTVSRIEFVTFADFMQKEAASQALATMPTHATRQ